MPALTWGKLKNGVIPVAGKFNHAFVDGLHASRFFAAIESGFADPDALWRPAALKYWPAGCRKCSSPRSAQPHLQHPPPAGE
ncbi:Uncharacterised protein [Raoultella terrigena]|uniref:Chloramphenicol O-acetyltransferase n=1 Tax=Raoultella terrigena TaxID=577 RepID=A0A4U9CWQ7_RAOTE|nr:Uncharacterised protein [Raoultella terrigena]